MSNVQDFVTFEDSRLVFRDPRGEVVISFTAEDNDFPELLIWYGMWANVEEKDWRAALRGNKD